MGTAPIPRRFLSDCMDVSVPDGRGGFAAPVRVSWVRLCFAQSASGDAHRSADAGQGTVFVDAVNSIGAFDVPAGSRVAVSGHSMMVAESHACCDLFGRVHHWELKVR